MLKFNYESCHPASQNRIDGIAAADNTDILPVVLRAPVPCTGVLVNLPRFAKRRCLRWAAISTCDRIQCALWVCFSGSVAIGHLRDAAGRCSCYTAGTVLCHTLAIRIRRAAYMAETVFAVNDLRDD